MSVQTYTAWIRDTRTGGMFQVTVQAENMAKARMILEGQYGRDKILTGPG